jgi:hypothetical protein
MTIMLLLVRFCIWVLGFYNERLLKLSWASLGFALYKVGKLLCSYLCLFDTIIEVHAMNENIEDFLIEKWKWNLYVINPSLICDE